MLPSVTASPLNTTEIRVRSSSSLVRTAVPVTSRSPVVARATDAEPSASLTAPPVPSAGSVASSVGTSFGVGSTAGSVASGVSATSVASSVGLAVGSVPPIPFAGCVASAGSAVSGASSVGTSVASAVGSGVSVAGVGGAAGVPAGVAAGVPVAVGTSGSPSMSAQTIKVPSSFGARCRSIAKSPSIRSLSAALTIDVLWPFLPTFWSGYSGSGWRLSQVPAWMWAG